MARPGSGGVGPGAARHPGVLTPVHVGFRVEHTRLDRDDFWDEWERETQAALAAIDAGVVKSLYVVAGQRRVIGIVEVESHDRLDQIVMGALPMSHHLTLEEVLPVLGRASRGPCAGAPAPGECTQEATGSDSSRTTTPLSNVRVATLPKRPVTPGAYTEEVPPPRSTGCTHRCSSSSSPWPTSCRATGP